MKAKELREQRAKLVLDAQKIMGGDKVSKEQRGQVDKMLADAEELRKDAERLEQIDKLTEGRSAAAIPRGNPDGEGEGQPADARSHEEQRSATGKALRSWLKKEQFEHRDLSVSANGGVMIPTAVVDPKVAKKAAGSVYDLVYKLRTATGEPVKAPMLNDIDNGFVLNSTASSTTDPATGGVTLSMIFGPIRSCLRIRCYRTWNLTWLALSRSRQIAAICARLRSGSRTAMAPTSRRFWGWTPALRARRRTWSLTAIWSTR